MSDREIGSGCGGGILVCFLCAVRQHKNQISALIIYESLMKSCFFLPDVLSYSLSGIHKETASDDFVLSLDVQVERKVMAWI